MRLRRVLLIFLVAALGGFSPDLRSEAIEWVLPWDDSTPGVTDFSSLNSPIGPQRISVDANGHFTVKGNRVPFLGFNLAGDAPFMPTNNAEAVAARLAKFGINAVRLHHMDSSWAYNGGLIAYSATTSTNLNPAQLERVHYLVSRLKAHGIYSDVNLLVGRQYRAQDGLGPEAASMDEKDAHILGYFYEPALALQKDYATKVLTPVNSFTGFSLAKDTAVAFVEIINENGIIQKWLEGGLDRLPAHYAAYLQARWNVWLAARYPNQAAMLAAWKVIDQPLRSNLLNNGDFNNGLAGWFTEQQGSARATFVRTVDFAGGPCAEVSVSRPDATSWHVQFSYPGLKLDSTQHYTLSFRAKSDPATNAYVSVVMAHDPWSSLGMNQDLKLTTTWQHFNSTFQLSAGDTNARICFSGMGDKLATFWFADVRLQPGGQIGAPPPGTSLTAKTVPNVRYSGSGFNGTHEARRDWLEFLRNLEYAYFDAMVGHLRTNIGYDGLVFGTIVANSPATVQSRMDVVDAHAYWQHPRFPGRPWDSHNWQLPNISMVNTLGDDNTIAGLARQRIHGKPFTVTEYQHPSPNYHGAEGPLMLAAYAALQDWDGLWFFDYGPGNDMKPMGRVLSYFDTDQHPAKMANLLLAANLFRRGDVRAAAKEYTMALTPERELDLLEKAHPWGIFSSSQLGMPPGMAFTSRIDTSVGVGLTGLTAPATASAGGVQISDTGELDWDARKAGKGLFTFNTDRTKGFVGFCDNQQITLGDLNFRVGNTQLGWCTLGMTLTRGNSFTHDCTALIVATGWWENTDQVWTDASKDSVGENWGRAPVLTEVVPFSLTLPVGTNYVRVWSLDTRGQRVSQLPLTGDKTFTTLEVTSKAASIWYEVQVNH